MDVRNVKEIFPGINIKFPTFFLLDKWVSSWMLLRTKAFKFSPYSRSIFPYPPTYPYAGQTATSKKYMYRVDERNTKIVLCPL